MAPDLVRRSTPGSVSHVLRFRVQFAVLLAATAVIYAWNVGAAGYANTFYAAAVQASTRNPVAWLFGAVDSPGFITVDKPPIAFWWMGLWANLFGFSPWSLLLPQAALGLGTVALLVLTVRRWRGDGVALTAGAVFALTPVAVIMFRYDEPDPMLVFLLVAAAYAVVRAVDGAATRAGYRWLAVCGALVGLGFLTKMGVALFVVPAFALAYLVAAEVSWGRRIGQLSGGLAGLVLGAGWFMLLVALWPASSRPWIGGSSTNSLWQLAVGYNGVARLFGRHSPVAAAVTGRAGGHGPAPGAGPTFGHGIGPGAGHRFAGLGGGRATPGPLRLFAPQFAGQISWLLPVALLSLAALLWVSRRAGRTDRLRAAAILWGGWLLVAMVVLSFMRDMVNTYYPLVMAPPLAALVALGAEQAWQRRASGFGRALVAAAMAGSAWWAWRVLGLTPSFVPWLRWALVAAAAVGVLALCVPNSRRAVLSTAVLAAVVTGFAGPVAYTLDTVATPHVGLQAAAGPPLSTGRFGRARAGLASPAPGSAATDTAAAARAGGHHGWGRALKPDPAVVTLLRTAGTTWSAAVPSTMAAAGLELSSDTAVIGIGGFTGSDPAPTLAQFQALVAAGKVHYLIPAGTSFPAGWGTGGRRPGAGRGGMHGARGATSVLIIAWAQSHFASITVDGQTVYDLTKPTASVAR